MEANPIEVAKAVATQWGYLAAGFRSGNHRCRCRSGNRQARRSGNGSKRPPARSRRTGQNLDVDCGSAY